MAIIKEGDYVALKNVPDALWKVTEVSPENLDVESWDFAFGGGTVDVSNSAFAAYKEAVSVADITKHITKAEAKHIK